jgi:PKD repeat protein
MEFHKFCLFGILLTFLALAVTPVCAAVTMTISNPANGSYYDNLTKFSGSGLTTWTCPNGVTSVWYLVVAGGGAGGGGGTRSGGGGGAGGVLNGTRAVTPATGYNVAVGIGGTNSSGTGGSGGNSSFANTTAMDSMNAMGGGGGGTYNANGLFGGSGGGGGFSANGGGNIIGQGTAGGNGGTSNNRGAGGGGGNGTAGTTATTNNGGAGGDGLQFSITGVDTYFAGGGGGGAYQASTGGSGGSGGGGKGGDGTNGGVGIAGTAQLGGGGGGGNTSSNGAAGGDGVVYLRYFNPPTVAWSANPQSGGPSTTITFTDSSSGQGISDYSWNFNDGNTTHTQSPTHQFPCPSGTCYFSINHSVTNFAGTFWLNRSNYITITGPTVSITLNQSSIYLPLDPAASPATNSSLAIIATTNVPFSITVKDNSGRASGLGYMGNYTTSYQTGPLAINLASPLALTGTNNGSTTAVSITPPITTGSTLYTGSSSVSTQYLFNTFSQAVSYNDARVPTGSLYRIDLEFDITPT